MTGSISPVVVAAVAVAAGTGVGFGRPSLAGPLVAAAATSFACAFVARHGRVAIAMACALVGLALAAGSAASLRSDAADRALLPRLAERKTVVDACGDVLLRAPRSIHMRVTNVDVAREAWTTNEPLRVSGERIDEVRPGERLCAKGELRPPRRGRSEPPLLVADRVGERATSSVLRLAADVVRSRYSDAARRALPRTQAGLLLGMTDGDTSLLDEQTAEDFRTTGLAHIVAVSGYNVAVFLALVMVLVRTVVPHGRWLRVMIAMPTLLFFVFLTGLEPSVLRATVSAGIALVAGAGGRLADALRAAALAFVVLLLAAPHLLFDVGFQLSFGATIGIVVCGEALTARIAGWLRKETRFRQAVASGLGTTIAAQLAVAPLLAWHFGRIPGAGALANAVAIPLGGVIMLGGLITLSVAAVVPFLDWAPATMRLPLDAILWSAHAFANVPGASVGISVVAACGFVGGLMSVVARSRRMKSAAVAFMVVCGCAAVGQARAGADCDAPAVVALDVGQGSAVLLRSRSHAIVVDTGPPKGNVVGELRAAGVRRLDAVFVTHSHIDHALGALDIFQAMDVDALYGPPHLVWASGGDVIKAASAESIAFNPIAEGDAIEVGDIDVEVLWPADGELPPFAEESVDVNSLVMRATVGGVAVLLPGDIRSEQQRALARSDITAPVLIAPHHGSKDLEERFIEAVTPRMTLITVGAPNPYGLPAPEAVRAYAARGNVFRTDQDGRVTVCLLPEGAEVMVSR